MPKSQHKPADPGLAIPMPGSAPSTPEAQKIDIPMPTASILDSSKPEPIPPPSRLPEIEASRGLPDPVPLPRAESNHNRPTVITPPKLAEPIPKQPVEVPTHSPMAEITPRPGSTPAPATGVTLGQPTAGAGPRVVGSSVDAAVDTRIDSYEEEWY